MKKRITLLTPAARLGWSVVATRKKFLKVLALNGTVSSIGLLSSFNKKIGWGKDGGTTSNKRRSVQTSELSQLDRPCNSLGRNCLGISEWRLPGFLLPFQQPSHRL